VSGHRVAAKDGISAARTAGKVGEDVSEIVKNTDRIPSLSGNNERVSVPVEIHVARHDRHDARPGSRRARLVS
jgi:hypothetical protein